MTQITTLKDKEGKTLYPITSTQAVFDSNGSDLDTLLGNKVNNEQGKGLSTNDYTNEDKQLLTALKESRENAGIQFLEPGGYSVNGGVLTAFAQFRHSGLLPLDRNHDIVYNTYTGTGICPVAFFDCNRQYIGTSQFISNNEEHNVDKESFPAGAVYFCVSTFNTAVGTSYYSNGGDVTERRERTFGEIVHAARQALFDNMWIEAGWIDNVQYTSIDRKNHPDEPYILNGIPHTYELALHTYRVCNGISAQDYRGAFTGDKLIKTNFPIPGGHLFNYSMQGMFNNCSNLEIAQFGNNSIYPNVIEAAFKGCSKLREIKGVIMMTYISSPYWQRIFEGCVALESVKLNNLNRSTSLKDSPKLNYDSLNYLITTKTNTNTTAITITVHPDVYAKLTGDTTNDAAGDLSEEELAQWQGLVPLALAKDISFATD